MIVVGPPGAGQLDVATFRADASYSDGRRPDSVTYSTAEEDVKRRDFTINGLLYDPLEERVIDYVGGQQDLQRQVIRAIGDPQERIAEDKLRMLRAVRFASRLGFLIDAETRGAIESMAAEITVVSAERITEELRSMLRHPYRAGAISLCRDVGLLQYALPEAEAAHAGASQNAAEWQFTQRWLSALEGPSFSLALAVLLRNYQRDEGASKQRERAWSKQLLAIGRRMRISTDENQRLDWLVRNVNSLSGAREKPWSQVQRTLIEDGVWELLSMNLACLAAEPAAVENAMSPEDIAFCQACLEWPAEKLNPEPLVTGDDLIEAEIPRGKHYQQILTVVRDAQLDGEITTAEAGMRLARQVWNEINSEAE